MSTQAIERRAQDAYVVERDRPPSPRVIHARKQAMHYFREARLASSAGWRFRCEHKAHEWLDVAEAIEREENR